VLSRARISRKTEARERVNQYPTMSKIRPFKINIPQQAIEKLHQKLELTNYPGELEEAGEEYGASLYAPSHGPLCLNLENANDLALALMSNA
jgi:hypothetical protein